ncbi:unnamed protein product [Amoebophrya sp. A120]|nr:unnamed protein product [Amoebophrya sp. A120]|eukprot:GSA120T00004185001.1
MQSPLCGMYCSCTSCYERSILEACTEAECSATDFGTAKIYNLDEPAHLQPVTELFQMDSEDEEQQSMGENDEFCPDHLFPSSTSTISSAIVHVPKAKRTPAPKRLRVVEMRNKGKLLMPSNPGPKQQKHFSGMVFTYYQCVLVCGKQEFDVRFFACQVYIGGCLVSEAAAFYLAPTKSGELQDTQVKCGLERERSGVQLLPLLSDTLDSRRALKYNCIQARSCRLLSPDGQVKCLAALAGSDEKVWKKMLPSGPKSSKDDDFPHSISVLSSPGISSLRLFPMFAAICFFLLLSFAFFDMSSSLAIRNETYRGTAVFILP